ncbi:MAG TPA: DEAD/DEAH box helicase, partial [Clostridia bacterium]|nr:DEAD/DEAH box helicase [Clostridia bacterium]
MIELLSGLNINMTIADALKKENIVVPTEVQRRVIPEILKNKDLIVESETGTGKTLAYLIPLFQKLNASVKEMQSLILVPTHELAVQVIRQIERLSQNSDITL